MSDVLSAIQHDKSHMNDEAYHDTTLTQEDENDIHKNMSFSVVDHNGRASKTNLNKSASDSYTAINYSSMNRSKIQEIDIRANEIGKAAALYLDDRKERDYGTVSSNNDRKERVYGTVSSNNNREPT